jgi:SAM-dependent methyltransferase
MRVVQILMTGVLNRSANLRHRLLHHLAKRLGAFVVFPNGAPQTIEGHDVIPVAQYDYLPRGQFVFGAADRFLLVPKNRYRVSLLPGEATSDALGVGWVTEANTPEGYDQLWGSGKAVEAYMAEGAGVRERMPHEIIGTVREAVQAAKSICDIGCGVGDLLAAASEVNRDAALSGLDFSPAGVSATRQRFPAANVVQHVIVDSLPFPDAAFDIVFSTDVLEHLEHRTAAVQELVRICAPGGTVVIVVPDGDVDQFFGHVWFFNEASLSAFLAPWQARISRLPDCREFIAIIRKAP